MASGDIVRIGESICKNNYNVYETTDDNIFIPKEPYYKTLLQVNNNYICVYDSIDNVITFTLRNINTSKLIMKINSENGCYVKDIDGEKIFDPLEKVIYDSMGRKIARLSDSSLQPQWLDFKHIVANLMIEIDENKYLSIISDCKHMNQYELDLNSNIVKIVLSKRIEAESFSDNCFLGGLFNKKKNLYYFLRATCRPTSYMYLDVVDPKVLNEYLENIFTGKNVVNNIKSQITLIGPTNFGYALNENSFTNFKFGIKNHLYTLDNIKNSNLDFNYIVAFASTALIIDINNLKIISNKYNIKDNNMNFNSLIRMRNFDTIKLYNEELDFEYFVSYHREYSSNNETGDNNSSILVFGYNESKKSIIYKYLDIFNFKTTRIGFYTYNKKYVNIGPSGNVIPALFDLTPILKELKEECNK